MSAIVRTLWYIEGHYREELGLDDLSHATGYSTTYLSRLFPLTTGYTVTGYLRGRRLSEAARQLADGASDILSVALDAGYGSHEAFTRAFRDQFGLTPDALRKRGSLETLKLVEAIRMDALKKVDLAEPLIERRPALRVAGLTARYRYANPAGIPDQWQQFNALAAASDGVVGTAAYGVVSNMGDGGYDYLSAMEVTAGADLPRGFVTKHLPARRWARFTHQGHVSSIADTCNAIFEDWAPKLAGSMADDVGFLEYYGPDFDPRAGTGTIEIWVALTD